MGLINSINVSSGGVPKTPIDSAFFHYGFVHGDSQNYHNHGGKPWEAQHGPIHSYSFRLKKWDNRFWERAWVNRMALFLREWAGNKNSCSPDTLFGELPNSDVILTHDVDAISKTLAISLKQSAFTGFNIFRNMAAGNVPEVGKGGKKACQTSYRSFFATSSMIFQSNSDCEFLMH